MTKKISRIISAVMFAAAVMFFLYALNHPEGSFPWGNEITYILYGIYLIVMVVLTIVPFGRKGDGHGKGKKRKTVLILTAVLILAALLAVFAARSLIGSKPFEDLEASDIQEASVEFLPPGDTITLDRNEIEKLTDILNDVIIYRRDGSYRNYNGQSVIFTIIKTDGSQVTVNAFNPFLVINDTGYRTEYEFCGELASFGNSLRR